MVKVKSLYCDKKKVSTVGSFVAHNPTKLDFPFTSRNAANCCFETYSQLQITYIPSLEPGSTPDFEAVGNHLWLYCNIFRQLPDLCSAVDFKIDSRFQIYYAVLLSCLILPMS